MNKRLIVLWAVRILLIALILFWMTTIFGFSAANGEESSSLSDRITIKLVHFVEADYDSLSKTAQQKLFHQVSFVVRKTGHFGEYGILAGLWLLLLLSYEKVRKLKWCAVLMIPTIICLIYGVFDEVHQGFVEGRAPKIMDVMIDTAGGFAGAVFIWAAWLIFRRTNERLGKKC